MDPAVEQLLQAARRVRDCQGDSEVAWTHAHILLYDAVSAVESAQASATTDLVGRPLPAAHSGPGTAARSRNGSRPARRASNWGPTEPSRAEP